MADRVLPCPIRLCFYCPGVMPASRWPQSPQLQPSPPIIPDGLSKVILPKAILPKIIQAVLSDCC